MQNDLIISEDENIEDLIYEIKGKQVMFDFDLARIYKCTNGTKEINQAVKRNPLKFPERFSFILNDKDSKDFLVTNCDQKIETRGGKYKNPRVFTEEGVAMLATILKTSVATEVSIRIMDAFVKMRHLINNNIDYFKKIGLIEDKLIIQDNKIENIDNNIKLLKESFNKLETKEMKEFLFFDGQVFDAYFKIIEILNMAKEEIIIIDSYADIKLLNIIKDINKKIIIITKRNNLLKEIEIDEYNKQYSNLEVIYNDSFHDRYIILDKEIFYSVGTSFNYLGNKTFGINKIDENDYKDLLINKIKNI